MTHTCATCGHYIENVNGSWLDADDDDQCYDDDTNLNGVHAP